MNLTEALNLARIRSNFASFFKMLQGDITGLVISILSTITSKLLRRIFKHLELRDKTILINDLFINAYDFVDSIDSSVIESELPTVYMEKILSEFKRIFTEYYYNKNNLKQSFFVDDYSSESAGLFNQDLLYLKTIIQKYDYDAWINNLIGMKEFKKEIGFILNGYASLLAVKIFMKQYGLNSFASEFNQLEKMVYEKSYNFYNDLLNLFKQFVDKKIEKKKSQMRNRKVFENENIEVYKVDDSREACILLGKGTDWCVANTHTDTHYKEYSSYGDMYVFIFKKLKNKFDGVGQEKALLTVKNKVSPENEFDGTFEGIDFKLMVEAIKNNEFKLNYSIAYENRDMTEEVSKFIHDEDFNQINEFGIFMVNYYSPVFDYFANFFKEFVKDSIIPTPNKSASNIEIIYSKSLFDQFFNDLSSSIKNMFLKFSEKAFNINKLEKELAPHYYLLKKMFRVYRNFPWLNSIKFFKKIVVAIFNDKKLFVNNVKYSKYMDQSIGAFFKYPLILRDSGNHSFDLIESFKSKDQKNHYYKLSEYMLEWPDIQKLFNVDINDLKIFINFFNSLNPLSDDLKQKVETVYDQDVIDFIANKSKLEKISSIFDRIATMYYNIRHYIKKLESTFPDHTLTKLLSNYEKHPEISLPLSSVIDSGLLHTKSFEEIELYNNFLEFWHSFKHEEINQIINVMETCFLNSMEYWEKDNFFEADINKSNISLYFAFTMHIENEKSKYDARLNSYLSYKNFIKFFLTELNKYLYNKLS